MKVESTTIKISRETKQRLDNLKEHEKESYNEIIRKILYILNLIRKNPSLGNNALNKIDKTIKWKEAYSKQVNQLSNKF